MTTVPAPNPKEVQEFQFKLLARLRIFKENPNLPLKQSLSLVAVAAKYGLICVGTQTGFEVIETAKIVEQCGGVKKPAAEITDFSRRSIDFGAQPSHLDISCDGQHLAVDYTVGGASAIRIYDVTTLASQNERLVSEVRLAAPLRALSWNPGISNQLAACNQDGSAAVYEFKNNSFEINSIPAEAYATCLCWSPRGKQIVIGSRNGSLNQFKPDLKIVKTIPPPQGDVSVVSIQWLSSLQYAAVYCTQSTGSGPSLVIVNTPRNQPITYINYDDITYSNGLNRLTQFYFIHQQTWNVLLVGSANSMEVGVLGLQGEWEQWQLEDAARAELPLSPTKQETHPVGMAFDTSAQYNLPWGENQHLPPMPLLLLLSHEGLLTLYWTVNLLGGATTVCTPPNPLPDTSGLKVVSPPQVVAAPPPAPAATSSPQWQQPPPTSQPAWIHTSAQSAPQPESKQPTNVVPGSWMTPTSAPPAFMSSLAQSAFSSTTPAFNFSSSTSTNAPPPVSAAPAFGLSSTTTPTAAFGISSTTTHTAAFGISSTTAPTAPFGISSTTTPTAAFGISSTTTPAFGATPVTPHDFSASSPTTQTPFSFASLQASDSFGKPGAFVSSAVPASSPITPVSSMPPVTIPAAKVDLPAVPPTAHSPVSRPLTPEQEHTEESQELKAMNDALIQEAIKEEITHFDRELALLSQRVRNVDMRVLDHEALESLTLNVNSMSAFMKDLKETTVAQEDEIDSLRSFLLEAFAYVESMRARIRLQNNPDYMGIHSPQGLDPLQARKMADIKRNLQLIEFQLSIINSDLSTKWITLQESNKENREIMQIPSLESIYQAMVLHNNVMMGQKKRLDSLEKEARAHNRRRLIRTMNVSHNIDNPPSDNKDTEFSRISQDFLSLNLSKLGSGTSVDDLQKSILSLKMSGHDIYLPTWKPAITSEKINFLKEVFAETKAKCHDLASITRSSHKFQKGQSLPIEISTSVTGSISSGQPLTQSTPAKTLVKVETVSTANKTTGSVVHQLVKPSEESKNNASITPISTVTTTSFFVATTKTSIVQNPTSSSNNITQNDQVLTQSIKSTGVNFSKQNIETKSIPKTSSTVPNFGLNTSTVCTPQVTAQQAQTAAFSLNHTKGPSFTSFVTSQPPSPFSLNQTSVSSSAMPSSLTNTVNTQSPAFAKPQPFIPDVDKSVSSTATVSAISGFSSFTTTFGKNDPSKPLPLSSTASFPFKIVPNENTFTAGVSVTTPPASSHPLSSLSSLVSGIEPVKSDSDLINFQNKVQASNETNNPKTPPNQPFVFKVPSASESKNSGKESSQNANILGNFLENKSESKETVAEQKGNKSEGKAQFGAFTKLPSDSLSPKLIFGNTSQGSELEITKLDPMPKSVFSSSNAPSKNLFSGSSVTTSPPQRDQKAVFSGSSPSNEVMSTPVKGKLQDNLKSGDFQSKNMSPVIEVSLSTSKSGSDSKAAIEKLAGVKDITITKVDSSERKSSPVSKAATEKLAEEKDLTPKVDSSEKKSSPVETSHTDNANTSSSMFGSLNLSSFTTPTKPVQSVFGGLTTPVKSSVMYEVGESNAQDVSGQELTEESKSVDSQKQPEATKPQTLFVGVSTPKPTPATSFTFSSSTLQSTSSSTGSTQTPSQSTSFSFGLTKLNAEATTTSSTTSDIAATQASSTFSFALATSQPSSTGFSFTVPSAPTSVSSTFGFDSLSTGSSEEKSKTGFSFGGQTQIPASTGTSIFGGFSTKSTEASSIFGQTATGDNKSVFGQTPPSTTDSKNMFAQISTTAVENKSIFDQTPATSAGAKPDFSFSLSTSNPSAPPPFFGGSQATTTTSFFGHSICSPSSTANSPFGQQPDTTPAFGSATASPFGGTSGFGSKPAFGQSGGSLFAQSSGGFGSSGTSVFGGNSTSGSSSLFGSSTSQPASPFSQSSSFGGGSFSTGGQAVGQTGFGSPAFQNKPAAFGSTSPSFGAAPSFGGAPTFGSSAFGSPQKTFGSSSASPTSAFGGASQQSATFGNLATQNTMTFGNLAQNQQPAFGSVFSTPAQSNPTAPAFPPTTSSSVFGGSSFSSWR